MNNFVLEIKNIDTAEYRTYFIDKFKNTEPETGLYNIYKNDGSDKVINKFENLLMGKYNFPQISYFLVFKHLFTQPIHRDGSKEIRFSSLNLALENYKDTKMAFYQEKPGIVPKNTDAHYYEYKDVIKIAEYNTTDNWTLINSGIPHGVIDNNKNLPRKTLCLRFENNPTYEHLANLLSNENKF